MGKKRTAIGVWLLTVALMMGGAVTASADDHGNAISTATPVYLNLPDSTSTAGSLESGGDYDYFLLDLYEAASIVVYSTGSTDTYGCLLNSEGERYDSSACDDDDGPNYNFNLAKQLPSGTYYLEVRGWSSATTGPYTVTVETHHGDSFESPTTLSDDDTVNAALDVRGDRDYFRLQLSSPTTLTVQTTGTTDTYGRLLASSGELAGPASEFEDDDSGVGYNFSISQDLPAGTYYVQVRGYSTYTTGPYVLETSTPRTPTALTIVGDNEVDEGDNTFFWANVEWSDGSTTNRTAESTWSENSPYAAISSIGELTASQVSSDQTVTVSASYTAGGVTVSDTHTVIINDLPTVPVSLTIVGAGEVDEGDNTFFWANVEWSDGSTTNRTAESTWSENSPYAAISHIGELTASQVSSDQTVTVSADFTAGGITVSDTHTVVIHNVPKPATLTISGAASVEEGESTPYTATVQWDDGTTSNETASVSWDEESPCASINSSGLLTANVVSSDCTVTISAQFSVGETTREDSHQVIVGDRPPAPLYVTATAGTYADRVLIEWSGVSRATHYRLFRADNSDVAEADRGEIADVTAPTTHHNDYTIPYDETEAYWVRACTPYACSGFSSYAVGFRREAELIAVTIEVARDVIDEGQTLGFVAWGEWSNGVSGTIDPTWTIDSPYATINDNGLLMALLVESDQPVTVTATHTDGGATLSASHTITIREIGNAALPGVVQFSRQYWSIEEGSATPLNLTVSRINGTAGAVTVHYQSGSGTATAGSDFTPVSGTLEWGDGDAADRVIPITILDDAELEGDEAFHVSLSAATGAAIGSPSTALITISEDEIPIPGVIQLGSAHYQTDENGGEITLTLVRTGGSTGAAEVLVSTVNGSAVAGSDFVGGAVTIRWADGEDHPIAIPIPLINDDLLEEDETFQVRLSQANGAALGTPSSATVTIIDDEIAQPGIIRLGAPSYSVEESDGLLQLSVERISGTAGTVSVDFTTTAESASAEEDYSPVSGTLEWSDGDDGIQTITLPILDDEELEGPETLHLLLSNVVNGELGDPSSAQITIIDDELPSPGTIQLSAAEYRVDEPSGEITLEVTRADGASGAASVRYATSDIEARAGDDYTADEGTLQWADGDDTPQLIRISLFDDDEVEEEERFLVLLDTPQGAELGSVTEAVVTIVSDDRPTPWQASADRLDTTLHLTLTPSNIHVGETLAVFLIGSGPDGLVEITEQSGEPQLTLFDPRQPPAPLANEVMVEQSSWTLRLSDPVAFNGMALYLGYGSDWNEMLESRRFAEVYQFETLRFGVIQFTQADYTVDEAAGQLTIEVQRLNGTDGVATVRYRTQAGSADETTDFAPIDETLRWEDGDGAPKRITLAITDDSDYEQEESFQLLLTEAQGAALGVPAAVDIRITDDDVEHAWWIDALAAGPPSDRVVDVTIGPAPPDVGSVQNIYVGMTSPNGIFAVERRPDGLIDIEEPSADRPFAIYDRLELTDLVVVSIRLGDVTARDYRGMGLVVGYGESIDDLTAHQRYAEVYQFEAPPAIPVAAHFDYSVDGDRVTFDASGSLGAVPTFQWDFGDGDGAQGPSPLHRYEANGSYTVTLTVTDLYGDSRQHSRELLIDHGAPSDITLSESAEGVLTVHLPAVVVPGIGVFEIRLELIPGTRRFEMVEMLPVEGEPIEEYGSLPIYHWDDNRLHLPRVRGIPGFDEARINLAAIAPTTEGGSWEFEVNLAAMLDVLQTPDLFELLGEELKRQLAETLYEEAETTLREFLTRELAAGRKYRAFFSVDVDDIATLGLGAAVRSVGGTYYFDLADYFEVTEEGRLGWVTVWIDGHVGIGVGLPIGVESMNITPAAPDPKNGNLRHWYDTTLYQGSYPGFTVDGFELNQFRPSAIRGARQLQFQVTIAELKFNLYAFQIRRSVLEGLLDVAYQGLSGGRIDSLEVIHALAPKLAELVDGADISGLLGAGDIDFEGTSPIMEFTTGDGDPREERRGIDGYLTSVHGALDSDQTLTEPGELLFASYLHREDIHHRAGQFQVVMRNNGSEQADYFVIVRNVPEGWVVRSLDPPNFGWSTDQDDIANVDPGAIASTHWYAGGLDTSPTAANVLFELYHDGWTNTLLDTREVTLRRHEGLIVTGR